MTLTELKDAIRFVETPLPGEDHTRIKGALTISADVLVENRFLNSDSRSWAEETIAHTILGRLFNDQRCEIMEILQELRIAGIRLEFQTFHMVMDRLISAISHLPPAEFWNMALKERGNEA